MAEALTSIFRVLISTMENVSSRWAQGRTPGPPDAHSLKKQSSSPAPSRTAAGYLVPAETCTPRGSERHCRVALASSWSGTIDEVIGEPAGVAHSTVPGDPILQDCSLAMKQISSA